MDSNTLMPWYGAPPAPAMHTLIPNTYPRPDRSFIPGRIINNVGDIRPQDVPLDGNIAVFPQADKAQVILKYFDKNCELQTDVYTKQSSDIVAPEIAEAAPQPEQVQIDLTQTDAFRELEQRISALENKQPKVVSLVKKED